MENPFVVLDGPIGTQLGSRGIDTPLPYWSAIASNPLNQDANNTLRSIHQDYDRAGATIHTANTFRTKRRTVGEHWRKWTEAAVRLARSAVREGTLVAGGLAPLEDCYRPDLAPDQPDAEHIEMAKMLRSTGCDLILCETFCNANEAQSATRAAVKTGLPVWVSLTAGPNGDLMSAKQMAAAARQCVGEGANAVLVNCTPASSTLRFVEQLVQADLGVPIGAYANAGMPSERMGWCLSEESSVASARRYLKHVRDWASAGATILGGCCGTGPEHTRAISRFVAEST